MVQLCSSSCLTNKLVAATHLFLNQISIYYLRNEIKKLTQNRINRFGWYLLEVCPNEILHVRFILYSRILFRKLYQRALANEL